MKKLFFAVLLSLLISQTANSGRIYVPDDYATLQEGIDASPEFDTIVVSGGTYTGPGNVDLNFNGKNLVLVSRGSFRNVIIDCNGSPSEPHVGFIFDNGESSASKIDGFIIRNAYAEGFVGAVTCMNGAVTLNNCTIEDNLVSGVIYSNYSSEAFINNCLIQNNTYGIGYSGSLLHISNSTIMNNTSGGIFSRAGLTMTNTQVIYNSGYGLYNTNGFPQEVLLDNCTFAFNDVGFRYEMELPKSSAATSATITESIFAFNQTGIEAMLADVTLACSDIYSNFVTDFFNVDTTDFEIDGNFSADPLFCDTTTQFLYLTTGSPCLFGNNSCGLQIGALGYHECSCCKGIRGNTDNDPNDEINISDLVYSVAYAFSGGPPPLCFEEHDINGDGFDDIGDIVFMVFYMFTPGSPAPPPCPYISD